MIDIGTLAGLLEHDHKLAAYCLRCDARRVLPYPISLGGVGLPAIP